MTECEQLLKAARELLAQFDAITAHQHRLLVEGQTFESASANWDKATLGQSIDFAPLQAAVSRFQQAGHHH